MHSDRVLLYRRHKFAPSYVQYSCTLMKCFAGVVYALGRAEYGRLGLGQDATESSEPRKVTALSDKKCVSVNCGTCVSFAVSDAGASVMQVRQLRRQ